MLLLNAYAVAAFAVMEASNPKTMLSVSARSYTSVPIQPEVVTPSAAAPEDFVTSPTLVKLVTPPECCVYTTSCVSDSVVFTVFTLSVANMITTVYPAGTALSITEEAVHDDAADLSLASKTLR